jgi:hypothetical protein
VLGKPFVGSRNFHHHLFGNGVGHFRTERQGLGCEHSQSSGVAQVHDGHKRRPASSVPNSATYVSLLTLLLHIRNTKSFPTRSIAAETKMLLMDEEAGVRAATLALSDNVFASGDCAEGVRAFLPRSRPGSAPLSTEREPASATPACPAFKWAITQPPCSATGGDDSVAAAVVSMGGTRQWDAFSSISPRA